MKTLDEFRNFNKEGASLDELMELSAFGRSFAAEHEQHGVPVPEYVESQMHTLKKEISSRVADQRANRRKQIDRELATMESADEKRKRLIAEREKIDQAERGE